MFNKIYFSNANDDCKIRKMYINPFCYLNTIWYCTLICKEINTIQEEKGIQSEYIFVKEDGSWITTGVYESFVRGVCENCGLDVKNTHSFRMSLNSYVFVENGIDVSDRANMLGHSKATNLKYYTHSQKGYVEKNRLLLNNLNAKKETTELPPNVVFMHRTYSVHTKKKID